MSSEVRAEFAEGRKNDQLSGARHDWFVFELPGMLVWNVHRIEANLHGRIDVAARAVADHPAVRLHDLVFAHQFPVSVRAFLGNNFDELEKALQTRALDLIYLLARHAVLEERVPL